MTVNPTHHNSQPTDARWPLLPLPAHRGSGTYKSNISANQIPLEICKI